MEQARYWMWAKRKQDFGSHIFATTQNHPSYVGDSWEEQAFAEDAGGALGGCVWPPRSYSCSFCRREFKSAQALGGHMNVHRRDRARLKQSPTPHHSEVTTLLPHGHHISSSAFMYNHNSNSDHHQESPMRVASSSSSPPKTAGDEKLLIPPVLFASAIVSDNCAKSDVVSSPPSWSNLVANKYFPVSVLKNGDKRSFETSKSNGRADEEYVKADLSVSLNLLLCRTHSNVSDAEDFPSWNKRRRIDHHETSFTFLPKSSSSPVLERCGSTLSQADVPKLSPNSIEDLDLELRLGDPPKA